MAAANQGPPEQVVPPTIGADLDDIAIKLVVRAPQLVELFLRLNTFPVRAAEPIAVDVSHDTQLL